jgi:very-short-patch-repair endonuclease
MTCLGGSARTDTVPVPGLHMPARRRGKYSGKASKRGLRTSTICGVVLPRVFGEPSVFDPVYPRSYISRCARRMRRKPTRAEREFKNFLLSLNGGALRNRFRTQHVASGCWIIDFFFPDVRLGIEIDGNVHRTHAQKRLDRQKEEDCARFDITLLRIKNSDVFGDQKALVDKLRNGWREAMRRDNKIIGKVLHWRLHGDTVVNETLEVRCGDCGHSAAVENPVARSRRFRCSRCGGVGFIQEAGGAAPAGLPFVSQNPASATDPPEARRARRGVSPEQPKPQRSDAIEGGYCAGCGKMIPAARLAAVPGTRLCVSCAEDDPCGSPSRSVSEPWGSRDAWKRDKASWKRTH